MEKGNQQARVHALVSGIVQGVGFRFFIYQTGTNLNLHGWVRNRISSQVEILAEGKLEDLNTLVQSARKGPYSARVEDVDVKWDDFFGDLPPFTILATE